jgi:hypothetical protein
MTLAGDTSMNIPGSSIARHDPDPFDFPVDMRKSSPGTRIFWNYEFGYIPPANPHPAPNRYDSGTTTIKMWHILVMIIEEVGPFWYRGLAGAWHQASRHKPQWKEAQEFVKAYLMPNEKYTPVLCDWRVSGPRVSPSPGFCQTSPSIRTTLKKLKWNAGVVGEARSGYE